MAGLLFKIPVTQWVRGTIQKMDKNATYDIGSWCDFWYETYEELGGNSIESGTKSCPKHAAYGLWRLGRIKNTAIPYQEGLLAETIRKYGKNTAYAELALELLEQQSIEINARSLWSQVQALYRKKLKDEPAKSQQGAITIALTLFDEDQIVTNDKDS